MTRKRKASPTNQTARLADFTDWFGVGVQMTEMMMASGQVAQARLMRMATAQYPLSSQDSAEFLLMGQEKAEAATESMIALSFGMISAKSPLALTEACLKPYRSRAMANAKRLSNT